MGLLLDTHTFLWLLDAPESLSSNALKACKDRRRNLFLSVVSAWEIEIKAQLGRLELGTPLAMMIQTQQEINGLEVVPVTLAHVLELERLPSHHKDPFDRLLVAQARVENHQLVTGDSVIPRYPVTTLW